MSSIIFSNQDKWLPDGLFNSDNFDSASKLLN